MPSNSALLMEAIFRQHYRDGRNSVPFERDDIPKAAQQLGVRVPKNLGGTIYQLRYSERMPAGIDATAPAGMEWVIRGKGPAKYAFELVEQAWFAPDPSLEIVELPSATPRIVEQHQIDDEQALLSRLRHSQVIAHATGLVVEHLQSHVRSGTPSGQVEVDDLYVGTDRTGRQYAVPVEAKGVSGNISLVQVEQGADFCLYRMPELACVPLGAKLGADGSIYVFLFRTLPAGTPIGSGIALADQFRFRLT
jgi:hypothetical protein